MLQTPLLLLKRYWRILEVTFSAMSVLFEQKQITDWRRNEAKLETLTDGRDDFYHLRSEENGEGRGVLFATK